MYALKLFSSRLAGQTPVYQSTLTQNVAGVEQVRRRIGGDWSLDFEIGVGDDLLAENRGYSESDLINALERWLGFEIREESDGGTWIGFVAEMELVIGGMKYKRSLLDNYYSHVRAKHSAGMTDWAVSDHVVKFGRRETELSDTSNDSAAAAQSFAEAYIAERGYPQILPLDVVQADAATSLHIGAIGYTWTAEWRLMDESERTGTRTVSETVQYLIETYCDELIVGSIADNSRVISQKLTEANAWSALQRLMLAPGPNGERYVLRTRGNVVDYIIEQPEPAFFIGRRGVSVTVTGDALSPRQIAPGVFRHQDYPAQRVSTRFALSSDFVVDEVVARGDDAQAGLRTADLDAAMFGVHFDDKID